MNNARRANLLALHSTVLVILVISYVLNLRIVISVTYASHFPLLVCELMLL